jgi:hypothetical protein
VTWKPAAGPRDGYPAADTIAGFYKYAVGEELLEHFPAAHVRRPRLDYESHAVALDRNELGALLVAAGLGPPSEHALISLLALNGLRVSEATSADNRSGSSAHRAPDRLAALWLPVTDRAWWRGCSHRYYPPGVTRPVS